MINKNFYRKTNDKKILHKVGKQWKVVSVALLMAIGGGAAVATHANAQQTTTNNFDNNATAQEIAGNDSVAKYSAAPKPVSSASAKSAKPASKVSYLSGYNGSAASYKAQAATDQSNYDMNNAIVQGYVNSLNAQYPKQTNSLTSTYNSAADQTSADQSSAASYSAIAAESGWADKVNSLAAKVNMSSSAYIESVGAQTSNYNSAVSNETAVNSQMSAVDSYANEISMLASNGYKNPLHYEMSGKAREAAANQAIASAYLRNAENISANVDNQSAANENSLYNNENSLASESTDEAIALINAHADTAYVQSLANKSANSNYANSSTVSNAVSLMASAFNTGSLSIVENPATFNDNKGRAVTTTNLNESDATNTINSYANLYSLSASSVNGANNVYDLSSAELVQEGGNIAASLAFSNDATATSSSANLVQEVSDTAAQFRYDSDYTSLENAINGERSAVSSYAAQSASASQGVQKAINNSSSAKSAYQAASVLAGNVTFADLFSYAADYTAADAFNHGGFGTFETKVANGDAGITSALEDVASNNTLSGVRSNLSAIKNALTGLNWNKNVNGDLTDGSFTNESSFDDAMKSIVGNNTSDAYKILTNAHNNGLVNNPTVSTHTGSFNDAKNDANALLTNVTKALNAINNINFTADNAGQYGLHTQGHGDEAGILDANSYSAAIDALSHVTSYAYSNDASEPFGLAGINNDNNNDNATMSYGVKAINSVSDEASTSLASDKASSASYSVATDANVALAGSYANSYSADANSDVAVQSAAKTNLDNFYLGHASDASKLSNAMSDAASYSAAVPSDNASAEANGLHVYNYGPKYIFTTHAAQLHTDTNYGSKDDKVLGKVAAGAPLTVLGVGFAANGATRYVVKVNGHKGYLTGNPYFVQQSYLDAMNNVDVSVNHSVKLYENGKATKTIKPQVLHNVNIVSMDGIKHGFTRVQVGYDAFVTANVHYVSVNGLAAGNTNSSEASQVQSESNNKLVNFQNDLL